MIVMLILMLLPVLTIPVFFFLPFGPAIAIYLVCLVASGLTFWLMRRTHRIPVTTGVESLINKNAEIVSKSGTGAGATYCAQMRGELWTARSNDNLEIGDSVTIVAVEGNSLKVQRKDAGKA
jgi:membrane protein implicated in regulation of membrane protease activity